MDKELSVIKETIIKAQEGVRCRWLEHFKQLYNLHRNTSRLTVMSQFS